MRINTFRDRLMMHPLDAFRNLISEIDELKKELRKQSRRVNKPICSYSSYTAVMAIASPLNKIFNYKKYSEQTSINMYVDALKKLYLLIQELREFERHDLANTLQHLYDKLFVLLPEGTVIQHQLFDTKRLSSRSKKPIVTKSFFDWMIDYATKGFKRRDMERRPHKKSLNTTQFSLSFRAC